MAGKRFLQGLYTPKNPEKYVGDITKIRYMSSYELEMHTFLDNNKRVLKWSSEPVAIPYIKPTDGKIHRYYPDYWVQYITVHGEIIEELIEVKPFAQTRSPRRGSKMSLYEQITFAVNKAKWEQAEKLCKAKGWKFHLITERKIFK